MKRRTHQLYVALLLSVFLKHAIGNPNAEATGAAIAPRDLIAEYTCVSYANAVVVLSHRKTEPVATTGTNRITSIRQLIGDYNDLLKNMCRDFRQAFAQAGVNTGAVYAMQYPRSNRDTNPFLANTEAARWVADSNSFLQKTAILLALYALAENRAPDLVTRTNIYPQSPIAIEVEQTSIGGGAKRERLKLIHLFTDKKFASLLPNEYDLIALAEEEQRLRAAAAKLRFIPSGWFNDNASDLVRMHFNGFDVMQSIGLKDVVKRYKGKLDQLQISY